MAFSTESQEPGHAAEMAPIEAAEKVQNFDKSGSGEGVGLSMSYLSPKKSCQSWIAKLMCQMSKSD